MSLNQKIDLNNLLQQSIECVDIYSNEFHEILRQIPDESGLAYRLLLNPENIKEGRCVEKIEELINKGITHASIFNSLFQDRANSLITLDDIKFIYNNFPCLHVVDWEKIRNTTKKFVILPKIPKIDKVKIPIKEIARIYYCNDNLYQTERKVYKCLKSENENSNNN
jgi:hypothetical protein